MAHEFRMERMVEFAETDMAGILHFSNYFRYMEQAEHAFFRSLGLTVHPHREDGVWGWARIKTDCTFRRPLRYEDVVELHLIVREKRSKTLRYDVVFHHAGTEVARGSITAVCVAKPQGSTSIEAIRMPADVAAAIDVAPPEPTA